MKRIDLFIIAALGLSSFYTFAQASTPESLPSSYMNQEGFFVGLGGSYNAINVDTRTSGAFNSVSGFPPNGVFSGTTGSHHYTQYLFAPEVQLGYFQHIECSDWLWGVKFLYQYLDANHNKNNIYINEENSGSTYDQVITSVKTQVTHELAGLGFIGHSFMNSFIYLGAGPSLFGTKNKIHNANDQLSGLYIGNLGSFTNQSQWMWGGMVQAGVNYYLNPTWFLDANYSYAITGRYNTNNSGSFSPEISGGLNTGTITFNNSKRMTEQSVMVSLNKTFF